MQPRSGAAPQRDVARFNPHPARRPDATPICSTTHCTPMVSILIRPEGRMQHRPKRPGPWPIAGFNPHPARRPDATSRAMRYISRPRSFNPHPARRPDATASVQYRLPSASLFQSSSGQKAGCNWLTGASAPPCSGFNPHPARRPDATCPTTQRYWPLRVSILIRPEGRMQPSERGVCMAGPPGFNPHPARRPDATPVSEFPLCSARTS